MTPLRELTPDQYDQLEARASKFFPNRIIQAFKPVTFTQFGYPTRINEGGELWKYHDVMHEGRFRKWLKKEFSAGMSEEELRMFTFAVTLTEAFGKTLSTLPLSSGQDGMSISLANFSRITALLKTIGDTTEILELGPGCGYLLLLLGLNGYNTCAFEITQALYLYQNRLFNYANDYCELKNVNFRMPNHPYWWDFITSYNFEHCGIVVANHMLNEMHPYSLRWILASLSNSWSSSSKFHCVYAEGLGGGHAIGKHSLVKLFAEYGFEHTQWGEIHIWRMANGESTACILEKAHNLLVDRERLDTLLILDALEKLDRNNSPDARFFEFLKHEE